MSQPLIALAAVTLAAIVLAGSLCLAEAAPPAPAAKPADSAKVLFIADEQKQLQPLAEFLRIEGKYDVQLVEPKAMPADLAPFFAVFEYIHGPMDAKVEKAIVEYATGGGRLVLLHHGLASARVKNPDLLRIAGIRIPPRNDPTTPWRVIEPVTLTVVCLAPHHYITTHGVTYDRMVEYASETTPGPVKRPALDLPDTEAFMNMQSTDGSEKTVLLGFQCPDAKTRKVAAQDTAGWLKPAGKGWLFRFQPGHAITDFQNRNYCQILLNCLTWRPDMPASTEEPRVKSSS